MSRFKPFQIFKELFVLFPSAFLFITYLVLFRASIPLVSSSILARCVGLASKYSLESDQVTLSQLGLILFGLIMFTIVVHASFRLHLYAYYIRARQKISSHIKIMSLNSILKKSINYFRKYETGFLYSKIEDLAQGIELLIESLQNQIMPNVIGVIISSIILYTIAPIHSFFLMITFITSIIGIIILMPKLNKFESEFYQSNSKASARIIDMLTQFLCIKLFVGRFHEKSELIKTYEPVIRLGQSISWVYMKAFLFYDFAATIIQGVQFYFLWRHIGLGLIDAQKFIFIILQNNLIVSMLWQVILGIPDLVVHYSRIRFALDTLYEENEINDHKNAKHLKVIKGSIQFRNVCFKYPTQDHLFFNNLSITIKAGEKIGLVGHSGSGKSTFVNLILRNYFVDSGSIEIDHININDVTQNSIYSNISIIPQDPMLFDRSIQENISYGKFNATNEEVINAAIQAQIHEHILTMPDGYDSPAINLSGGQKQRVSIARAILKDAPILILDEATSQLDSITENEIQHSLTEVTKNKTTIIIAHRLSTLSIVDRIIVFEAGSIVENGTHKELLAQNGVYANLFNTQASGYADERNTL